MPRTKFITTLGPASMNYETMKALAEAGADIFRCNFAHQQYDKFKEIKGWLAQINHELGRWVQLQADIQGPSIRLGILPDAGIELHVGEEYVLVTGSENMDGLAANELPVRDATIHEYVKVGEEISFMSGTVESEVVKVEGNRITVKMITNGKIKSKKALNLPETELASALTDKDREDLAFLMEEGIDWVAISFISKPEQIAEVRAIIGDRPTKITAKIERRSALDRLDDIVQASDAVMVARGDLGIEIPYEDVPLVQEQIVDTCHRHKVPVIIATQMLLSMTNSVRPTRAEVSDVANAVRDRVDAVMLSEESAEGIDPVNALNTQRRIVERMEEYLYGQPNYFNKFWQ